MMTNPFQNFSTFRRSWLNVSIAVFVFSLCLGAGVASAGGKIGLVSHRAVYEIELKQSREGVGPTAARGLMAYEFSDSCERWIIDNRIVLDVVYGEETPVRIDWTFTSWESKDGRQYGYNLVHKRNNRLEEELKGTAHLTPAGDGKAEFTGDNAKKLVLPRGTLFPTAHLLASFRAARNGQKTFLRTMFDGGSLDNPYDANVLFVNPKQDNINAVQLFKASGFPTGGRVLRLQSAFFSKNRTEGTPVFELEVDYREDGVAERIIQEFNDFSLLMMPVKAELIDGGC